MKRHPLENPTKETAMAATANLTLGIDHGGTFTDGVLTDGDKHYAVKGLTTPHDLTIAF
jgi:activator of 2-hydroxyglutaryl-CoA dehydratase